MILTTLITDANPLIDPIQLKHPYRKISAFKIVIHQKKLIPIIYMHEVAAKFTKFAALTLMSTMWQIKIINMDHMLQM